VDVYLDCGFLDWRVFVEVAEGLENVADIRATGQQQSQRTLRMGLEWIVFE
jgi:hypothetical protein